MAGLEPANDGVKVRCLDRLGYIPSEGGEEEPILSNRFFFDGTGNRTRTDDARNHNPVL